MLFVRQAPCQWRTKHAEMRAVQVRDLLLRGLPAGTLEEGRRPQNSVQNDPRAPPQNGGRRDWVVGHIIKIKYIILFFLKLSGAAASFGKGCSTGNFSTAIHIHVRPAVFAVSAYYVLNKLLLM